MNGGATRTRLALTCALGTLVSSCSGGRQSGSQVPNVVVSAPVQSATATPTAQGSPISPASSNTAAPSAPSKVVVNLLIPASMTPTARRRAYVSPSTQSLTLSENGGAAQTISLAPSSPSCSAGSTGRTCAAGLNAVPGRDQRFVIKLFASTDGSGSPLAVRSLSHDVGAGETTYINTVLDGVVSSVSVTLSPATLTFEQAGTTNVIVTGFDAAGNAIVGPDAFYDANGNPITISLTDSDTSGATHLSQTQIVQASTVSLSYSGAALGTVSIGAAEPRGVGVNSTAALLGLTCPPAAGAQALYLAGSLELPPNYNGPMVYGYGDYALGTSGEEVAPSNQVHIPYAQGVALDERGLVYVNSGQDANAITVYCPNASVDATPFRTYANAFSGDYAVDAAGDLYEDEGNAVAKYAADSGAVGAAAAPAPSPVAVISGSNTGLGPGFDPLGIAPYVHTAADAAGDVYYGTGLSILKFPSGTNGNAAPGKTITDTTGGLLGVIDTKADTAGNVFVLYAVDALTQGVSPSHPSGAGPALVEYAAGQLNQPERVIDGSTTQLGTYFGNAYAGGPRAITLDGSGNVFVLSEFAGSDQSTVYNEVSEFAPSQHGDVAPTRAFSVAGTSVQDIAADKLGNIAISDDGGSGILLYRTDGTYEGQLGAASDIGTSFGVTYDAHNALHASEDGSLQDSGMAVGLVTLAAPVTTASRPTIVKPFDGHFNRIAVDATGNTYGISDGGILTAFRDTVYVFPPDSPGGDNYMSGEFYDLTLGYAPAPTGLALDGNGNAYIGLGSSNSVDVVTAEAEGSGPVFGRTYADVSGSTIDARIAVDSSGAVYAASCATNTIAIYNAGQTTGPPAKTIAGSATNLHCPTSIALDAAGDIYTLDNIELQGYQIDEFAAGATGNVAPVQEIYPAYGEGAAAIAVGPGLVAAAAAERARSSNRTGRRIGTPPAVKKLVSVPMCATAARSYRSASRDPVRVTTPRPGTRLPGLCPGAAYTFEDPARK